MSTDCKTVIVGAGLAGLSCATALARRGCPCVVLEATDRVGGRVRTDHVDGFTMDHGFQVLLTAYPACRELLDYESLDLHAFEPGALIRQGGRFRILSDPWRRPWKAIPTALNPVGSIADKLRIAKLRRASRRGTLDDLYRRPNRTTRQRLSADGFGEKMIEEFFRPFLGGVFLDESLSTSSRMLEFVFRMFSAGDIALPAGGMSAIPKQLADRLPAGTIRLNAPVSRIEPIGESAIDGQSEFSPAYRVVTGSETFRCEHLVIATTSDTAARLLDRPSLATPWSGTTNLYYAADSSPDRRRLLMLRGDEDGPVQSVTVLSDVVGTYAPTGQSLISVSVDGSDEAPDGIDDEAIEKRVREQLLRWFGQPVRHWRWLSTYRVPYGLPQITMDALADETDAANGQNNHPQSTHLHLAGDYLRTPSIQGAMESGLRVARRISR